nr:hypothetical protein [uncultured Flavobacterium sp.]
MSEQVKYNFRVLHTINYKLFDKIYDVVNTYDVEINQSVDRELRLELDRHNFRINDNKIDKKFEKIAHEYNKTLFPVLFDVKEGNFSLANYNEISKRIARKDEELRLKHEGPGFDYIRNGFLEKVAKDGYDMAKYFYSFGLIRILLLCLEKTENNPDYNFHWEAIPIASDVFWNGKKEFGLESKILKYKGESLGTQELFEKIKGCGNAYQYPEKVTDEESVIATTIKHETEYITTALDFEFSETEIKISNSYFNYGENIVLKRK